MATEPKDAPSAQIESALAPPVAFTIIQSDASRDESVEPAVAPEPNDAFRADIEGAAAKEDDRTAAPASAFEQDFTAARDRMIAINVKILQASLTNAETTLDFLAALPSVRSVTELIALQSKFASKQVDAMVGPAAEIGAMTQNTMTSTVDSMRNRITRFVAKFDRSPVGSSDSTSTDARG